MRKLLPWLGLGVLTVAFGPSLACSDDSGGGGSSGKGGAGGIIDGGAGAAGKGGGTGGTAGQGGTSGAGGSAGASKLGRACVSDSECGDGLTCVKADSGKFGGGGPAKGYCSTTCTTDGGECGAFGSNTVCLQWEDGGESYCIEGCKFGPAGQNQFDPNKCHGRYEVACAPLFNDTGNPCGAGGTCPTGEICGTTNTCLTIVPACMPQCNSDADCGTGLYCDPSDGLCRTTQKTGKPVGATCVQDLDATVDECRGNCIGFVHESGQDPFTYMCAENCTTGALPACGWAGPSSGTPAPAGCLFTSTVIIDAGGPSFGDRGSCGQFCDCNTDCLNGDLVCRPFNNAQTESFYQKKGFCSDPLEEDGGMNPGVPCTGTGGSAGTGGTAGTGGAAGAAGAGADGGA